MDDLRTGLSYGDVLLVPQRSPVESRHEVDLSTRLTPTVELATPILSAPMDTVTESETAIALSEAGGFGTIHRFMEPARQADEVATVSAAGQRCGAAVGINEDYLERARAVVDAGATCVVVDVAHAHLEACLDATAQIRAEVGEIPLVVGNVATPDAVHDLAEAGADGVKVGVGPGSHCTTRKVAGAGVPQLTAVADCAAVAHDRNMTVIADGGIRSSGDAVKALMAGADTVMMGSLFAGTEEAPSPILDIDGRRYKRSRGMATTAANADRSDKEVDLAADEGVEALTPYKGPLQSVAREFAAGVRSGLSYCGGRTIEAARERAEFIRVAPSAKELEGAHGDHDWEGASVDGSVASLIEADADD